MSSAFPSTVVSLPVLTSLLHSKTNEVMSSASVWIFLITLLDLSIADSEICYSVKDGSSEDCNYGCCGSDGDKTCCSLLGVIIGAVVGSIIAIGAVVGVVICCLKSHKHKGRTVRPSEDAALQRRAVGPASTLAPPPSYSFTGYSSHYIPHNHQRHELTGKSPPPSYNDPAYPPLYHPPGHQAPYTPRPSGQGARDCNTPGEHSRYLIYAQGRTPLYESPPPYSSPTYDRHGGMNSFLEDIHTQSGTNVCCVQTIPTTVINASVSNPGVSNPTVLNTSVSNPTELNTDVSNYYVVSDNSVSNQTVSNSSVLNPTVSNCTVSNTIVSSTIVSNTIVSNTNVSNPYVLNPTVSNHIV
ncbi:uncharacterized protein LOC121366358 [Gigantopelta aegis]|uniref:uncharacterized protein LOC121366358 n=1 Tax=Gigantopelta aegis TaxID=1735272 RepID=UPI001B88C6B5|nr:uncharacterized protein LOC121366358 [Gigantopelta aegis]